jgi:hypothetical protein
MVFPECCTGHPEGPKNSKEEDRRSSRSFAEVPLQCREGRNRGRDRIPDTHAPQLDAPQLGCGLVFIGDSHRTNLVRRSSIQEDIVT